MTKLIKLVAAAALAVLVAGCSTGSAPTPPAGSPSPLAPPTAPVVGGGVATATPTAIPQNAPSGVARVGVAISVSSVTYTPGQAVVVAARAPAELAGHPAFVISTQDRGREVALARGRVSDEGSFTLEFLPKGTMTIRAAVSPAAGSPVPPTSLDDVVAASAPVTVRPA